MIPFQSSTNVIFLGTAGGNAVSRQARSSGGIIIQSGNLQFHLDPGPGALNKAKEFGLNLNNTIAVIVSHNHIGHCNDLNAIVDAMTHSGMEHRGVILGSKSVLLESEENHPFLTKYHSSLVEKIIPLENGHKVGLDNVEITAFSTNHSDSTAMGFRFKFPHYVISYTGDTKLTPELLAALEGTQFLILNVPFPGNKSDGLNLDSASALKIISSIKPKIAVLTHFSSEMLKADPLNESREIQRATGIPTIAARDGLVIVPENYSITTNNVKGFN